MHIPMHHVNIIITEKKPGCKTTFAENPEAKYLSHLYHNNY